MPLSGRVTARAAKPAASGLLGQSGALSVSGTACRPRRDPPGVPRGYRRSGLMVSRVRLAGRGRGYPRVSSGSDTFGDTIPASGRFISNTQLSELDYFRFMCSKGLACYKFFL